MKQSSGFTIIELIIVILFVGAAAIMLIYQRDNIQAAQRDDKRKIAINAMYYNLEEVFYERNGHYPEAIDSKTLTAMDPDLFIDPDGFKLGQSESDYRYNPIDCNNEKCKGYTLTGQLEKEVDFTKTNRNK